MKNWTKESLYDFRFLSGLRLSTEADVYRVARLDEKENRYISDLFARVDGREFLLASDVGGFLRIEDDRVLFTAHEKPSEEPQGKLESKIYTIDVRGGERSLLWTLPFAVSDVRVIDDEWLLVLGEYEDKFSELTGEEKKAALKDDRDYEVLDEIPYWQNGVGFTNKKRTGLYLYNTRTEAHVRVTDAYTEVMDYDFDLEGRKVLVMGTAFMDKAPLTSTLEEVNLDTLESRPVGMDRPFAYASAAYWDGDVVFTGSDMETTGVNEDSDIYLWSEAEGVKRLSPADWDVSLWNSVGSDLRYGSGMQEKVDGAYFYFITTEWDSSYLNRIDKNGKIERVTEAKGSVDFYDVLDGRVVIAALRDMRPQELYLVEGHEETRLTHHNDVIDEYEVFYPEVFSFTSGDATIDGYVIRPKDYRPDGKYPGILTIHGGPKTAFGETIFHEMQFFAAQGYFVFYTNPTGSDGHGRAFADIRGKYGSVDYMNLMDFTDEVLKRYPELDERRLGVMGGSYGGFMTNWVIGHTTRFAAAASQRSIANWVSKFGITDIGFYFVPDQQGGTPWSDVEGLWDKSPLKYAPAVKTPTLFIHSDEDYRCHLSCGLQMFTALKYHGIEARLCLFHGENHELSRSGKPKHRIRRLREMEDWFANYLGGKA